MYKKFSLREKFDMIIECRRSGLSDHQWCIQHDISRSTFYKWIDHFKKAGAQIPSPYEMSFDFPVEKPDIVCLDFAMNTPSTAVIAKTDNKSTVIQVNIGAAVISITNEIDPGLLTTIISCLGGRL